MVVFGVFEPRGLRVSQSHGDQAVWVGLGRFVWASKRALSRRQIETRRGHDCLIFIRPQNAVVAHSPSTQPTKHHAMKILVDLFSTDYGLMSLAVIVITLLMGVCMVRMFIRKMNNNE